VTVLFMIWMVKSDGIGDASGEGALLLYQMPGSFDQGLDDDIKVRVTMLVP
jgi:hypothetical protein